MESPKNIPKFVVNPKTGKLVSHGHEYNDIPRMRELILRANKIRANLPVLSPDNTRLWRGNRPDEIGKGSRFTDSLEGIALPFLDGYGGELSYIDIPTNEIDQYISIGGPSEFNLTPELAKEAKVVK